jgi:biotin transport system substrate-specific component
MSHQSTTTGTVIAPSTIWIRKAGIVLGASLLVGLAAHIVLPLPFTVVPISMAPFAVLLLGLMLTPRMAATALIAYLAEGAMGLPFFSPTGPAGLAHLAGPTAGYLFAYPIAAFLIAVLYRRSGRTFTGAVVSATLGSLILIAMGALWLSIELHLNLRNTLTAGVLPFLPGDALKVLVAAGAAQGWQRLRK